jgi:hypothetical protein
MPSGYLLARRLPDGRIKGNAFTFTTFARAARAAGQCLYDNGAELRTTAQKFGVELAAQPLGTIWGHPSGYDFRILRADFTVNGAMITPGLKVRNYYDAWNGTVDPAQFFRESPLDPGGEHFNHWYDVTRDGDERPYTPLNGERLTTNLES